MSPRRKLSATTIAAAILATPASAFAQQASGFSLDRFDPAERGSDWFTQESLDLRGNRPAIGVTGDYAHDPLVIYNADGSTRSVVVSDQLFLHVGGALVLGSRVRIGVNLPVALAQSGQTGTSNGTTFGAPTSAAVGDLRLGLDVRLLGEYGDPFTLAAGVQVFLPTGDQAQFAGDGSVRALPRLMAAGQVGLFAYSAKVGFEYRENQAFGGSNLGSELLFGAAAGMQALQKRLVVGPEVWGGTVVTTSEGPFKTANTPFEALLGAHYLVGDFRVGMGAGPGLTRAYGEPDFRVLAMIEWAPPVPADRDGDGIPDDEDACPDVPGVPSADPRVNGCPPDRDRDGVPDSVDACPEVPGVHTDDPKTNGCPPDRDKDGVPDAEDACPDVPGIRTADPKTNGCPPDRDKDGIPDAEDACPEVPGVHTDDPTTNGCPPDRDKDGVPDAEDACPDVPGVHTADPKTNGCPADRDADGIPDAEDACPDVPGPRSTDPKKNGCPLAYVQEKQIKISEQVKFRFNSAELDPAGDPVLQAVLKILKDNPGITKVEIQGHTDNVGAKAYNQTLSTARAQSVMRWLVKHGVDAKRLTAKGYGMSVPIADNTTDEGRRDNRRVEFHIEQGSPQSQ